MRTTLSLAAAAILVASASAQTVPLRITGTVSSQTLAPPSTGPFSSIGIGDPFTFEILATVPGMAVPNDPASLEYSVDSSSIALQIGAVSDPGASGPPNLLTVATNSTNSALAGTFDLGSGSRVTVVALSLQQVFSSLDLLALTGTYDLTQFLTSQLLVIDPQGEVVLLQPDQLEIGLGGSLGSVYCSPAQVNSTGGAGVLRAAGSLAVADNDVTLLAAGLPPNAFVLLLASQQQGLATGPGGSQGDLCLAGSVGRFLNTVQDSGAIGAASFTVDLTVIPQPTGTASAVAGQTWNFQAWYRDANPTLTSNFTDAVSLTFE